MTRFFVICLCALFLSGCHRGPDKTRLKQDVQSKLDQTFSEGLFEVDSLKQFGSQPYSSETDAGPDLLVYYKAKCSFLQDYNLSTWNKLNIGTLAYVFGASSDEIQGVNKNGNLAGDQIKVWGTIFYTKQNNQWVLSNYVIPQGEKQDQTTEDAHQESDVSVDYLSKTIAQLKKKNQQERLQVLQDELTTSVLTIQLKLAPFDSLITLVSGDEGGAYYAIGQGFQNVYQAKKIPFQSYESNGSRQNIDLVGKQLADFGIVQNDTAYMAYEGLLQGEETCPDKNLRAVCTLFPEAIQVIVLADSTIHSISDLRDKKLSTGQLGSGIHINAKQVLEAYGITNSVQRFNHDTMQEALDALQDKEIDAFFTTMAYPAHIIAQLASKTAIRFLSIEPSVSTTLQKKFPYFVPITLAKNTYPNQSEEIQTVGVTAMVIAHRNTSEKTIQQFLHLIQTDSNVITTASSEGYYISPKTMFTGLSIPMHRAAKAFFVENGD